MAARVSQPPSSLAHQDVLRLQAELADLGVLQEQLILIRQELLELAQKRTVQGEALSAREQESKVVKSDVGKMVSASCPSCGAVKGAEEEPVWFVAAPSSAFVLLPSGKAGDQLRRNQKLLEEKLRRLRDEEQRLSALLAQISGHASILVGGQH